MLVQCTNWHHQDDSSDVVDLDFSEIQEEFEELRTILVLCPEKVFKLETLIDALDLDPQNGSTVHIDMPEFRAKFTDKVFKLVEDLFELETDVRLLYQVYNTDIGRI